MNQNSHAIPAGFYQGRAVAGSEQYGVSKNGNDQIALDIAIPSLNSTFTTFLSFSEAAAPYAIERLRVCGWKGNDVTKLVGIDANEVTVQVKYETYDGKERMKVDIATGGGRITLENQMDEKSKRAFAARMKAFADGTAPKTAPAAKKRNNADPGFDPNAGFHDDDDLPL